MDQPWKTYLVVALIIGLLIGAGIGWVAKPPEVPVGVVPKADYDAAVSERDAAISERDAARSERDEMKSDYDKLEADYDALLKAGLTGEVKLGCLLGLTGGLATHCENTKAILEFQEEEVNAFLKEIGAKWTLKIIIEDTEIKPDIAVTKVESLAARGIKILIGFHTTDECLAVKGYCDANKILVVSCASTAPAAAIPDDYVYRFCPTDLVQGKALARLMYDDGIRYVITVSRGTAWGDGIVDATRERFEELGGTVVEGVRYAPEAKEFSAEAKALADAVTSAIGTYGADKVGVHFIGFEEVISFFASAGEYDVLWDVKWYGSDGTIKEPGMISDIAVAEFSDKTKFISPIFAPTRSDKYEKVVNVVRTAFGREPNPYSVASYDTVWAIVYSLLAVDKYDAEAVRAVLPDVTRSQFGATGWVVLNENGDRAAADYELWIIVFEDEEYKWKQVGLYSFATDSVTWL